VQADDGGPSISYNKPSKRSNKLHVVIATNTRVAGYAAKNVVSTSLCIL